jgi:hypothetical protein
MDIYDLLIPPFYLIVILFMAHKYKLKHQKKNKIYSNFIPGLLVKMLGAISLGLVYYFYYGGGDTVNYFQTASALSELMVNDFDNFIYVYFGSPNISERYLMGSNVEFTYWVGDTYAFFVSKCFTPIVFITGKSYMASAIIVASICYLGVWRLYLVFINEFPHLHKQLRIPILYMPSVIFWGSGLMKDSITFSAACLYVHGFYWFFIKKKKNPSFFGAILLGSTLLLSIKPYILFALFPGSIIWVVAMRVTKIKNTFLRVMLAPAIIAIGGIIILVVMQYIGGSLGDYSADKIIDKAAVSQKDLKQSYYGGNSFDIGDYEPTVLGILSVSHKAIFATLFRPTVLDVKNVVMFLSAVENTFILFFCIYLLIKLNFFDFFRLIRAHPLVLFSFIFSIFFAVSVGVSIANFGTLVRLKIPCIPFFMASLVIINSMRDERVMAKEKLKYQKELLKGK